ncbi:glycosyltransferase [Candidatus Woesearchaeota archaeon]|nr:glycosyltransferase [Candidatus Woesearchaeota archaeon]
MAPYFSIIIPAYNEENYIRKTLHSLKNQTYQDYEAIVVANGCTDATEELVRKRADEKLRLLSLPKANVCVARNAGALNAQGQVLLFLDADTSLSNDSLQKIKEEFLPEHSIASTKGQPELEKNNSINNNSNNNSDNNNNKEPAAKFRLLLSLKNFLLSTGLHKSFSGAVICRKEQFQSCGGYDPELIIREHHQLRKKLQKYGSYHCVNTKTTTSMRRFEKWSLSQAAYFWLKQEMKARLGKDLSKTQYEAVR